MAKYTVIHSCGHEVVHHLLGKQADRLRKIEWMESQLCPECYREELKKERQAANAAAAEKNAEAGLPRLEGTEKQVVWAETLLDQAIKNLDMISASIAEVRRQIEAGEAAPEQIAQVEGRVTDLGYPSMERYFAAILEEIKSIHQETSASWWIDNRNNGKFDWMRIIEARGLDRIRRQIDETPEAAEAIAEATMMPAYEPVVSTPAEITLTEDAVSIHFPVKNREFWEIVKPGLGFSWTGKHWQLDIGPTTGSAVDRAAETAHRLLAAGFKVVLWDQVAREKAVSGDYEPRHSRWIVSLKDGLFGIKWSRQEDFYDEAREITGSRWRKPYVTVPPSEYLEVLDFADIHDFRLSPGAQEIVAWQERIAAGATVVDVAPVKDPEPVARQERPDLDPKQVSGEIDEDLRDN